MYFHLYLAEKLDEHGMTQTALSEEIDVSSSLVSYWISGTKKPSYSKLVLVIEYFTSSEEQQKEHLYKVFFKQENK